MEDLDKPLTYKDLLVLKPDTGLPPGVVYDSHKFFSPAVTLYLALLQFVLETVD